MRGGSRWSPARWKQDLFWDRKDSTSWLALGSCGSIGLVSLTMASTGWAGGSVQLRSPWQRFLGNIVIVHTEDCLRQSRSG